jgi:hypothetical protein
MLIERHEKKDYKKMAFKLHVPPSAGIHAGNVPSSEAQEGCHLRPRLLLGQTSSPH